MSFDGPSFPRTRAELRSLPWLTIALGLPMGWFAGAALQGIGFGAITLGPPTPALEWVAVGGLVLGLLVMPAFTIVWALLVVGLPPARPLARVIPELCLLVVLPAWGFAANQTLPDCDPCGPGSRALASPHLVAVVAVYGVALVAYLVARLRPRPLPVWQELAVLVGLVLGVVTCGFLVLQFHFFVTLAAFFPGVGAPVAAPWVAGFAMAVVLILRVWRHGQARIGVGAGVIVTVLAGVDAVLELIVRGSVDLYAGAFTQTCGWPLSTMELPPGDCHYLCTVAAQGHPWLVRPIRLGKRRGRVIVVNRQLAVANAFEDLLHERWPRFGAWARGTYDRVGRPVSRWLLHPVAADVVFVAMLPAQLAFLVALLVLDPADPELRIDQMYR